MENLDKAQHFILGAIVAQDVQAVFPQAVRTREDGTLAVAAGDLSEATPTLTAAAPTMPAAATPTVWSTYSPVNVNASIVVQM